MRYQTQKGRYSGGEAIGILLLESDVPFIPGDVANATTYDFPVRFQRVKGFTVEKALSLDTTVYPALREAAVELAAQGVRAVTGDCGFMAIHQRRLTDELKIPIFLSSLLQLHFILAIIGEEQKVGILTVDSSRLDGALLTTLGIVETGRLVIEGMQIRPHFSAFAIEETGALDAEAVEAEVVEAGRKLVAEHEDIAALLLECSLLPPYAGALQEAVGLPVFDYVTMIEFVFSAVVKRKYAGFF